MEIGDKYTWVPSAFEGELNTQNPKSKRKPCIVTGEVVYIHPERRYFTVEATLPGGIIRESFLFVDEEARR